MYAHQVIDGLNSKSSVLQVQTGGDCEHITHLMMNSQKFHVDGMEILDLARKNFGKVMTCKGLKLPYPVCWFDWTYNGGVARDGAFPSSKRGAIVCDIDDPGVFTLRLFAFNDIDKIWCTSWIAYKTEPGYGRFIAGISNPEVAGLFNRMSYQELNEENQADLTIFINALQLLNCRNISTEITRSPDKLNIKRRKKGNTELFSYHTLVIKPVGKRQKTIPKHLWDNRIHLCRGHFKEYTEDHKLFGKYTGRFWWQPSVRGRNKKGIVLKDYIIDSQLPVPAMVGGSG